MQPGEAELTARCALLCLLEGPERVKCVRGKWAGSLSESEYHLYLNISANGILLFLCIHEAFFFFF